MVCHSLLVASFTLLPRALAEQSADTVTLVQFAARSSSGAEEALASPLSSPLAALFGTVHLEATLRDDFLSSRASDAGDVPAENVHTGEGGGQDWKSVYAGQTGDMPITVAQKCTPEERVVAEAESKKMLQTIAAKNGTGLEGMMPAACTADMFWGQVDLAKMTRVDAQSYGLCVRQLTGISTTCSECMIGQVEGYQSCSPECQDVQEVCNKAVAAFRRPLQTVLPLQQMATGASLRSCSMATATCARCTVKKLKDYIDCTGALNITQRRQYFNMVDNTVLNIASGIADLNKLGPKAADLVKLFR